MADSLFAPTTRPARRARSTCAAALAALALAAPGVALGQPGPSRVVVAPVEEREIRDEAPIIGSLVATVDSAVAATAAGVVLESPFKVGDAVELGDVVARLDPERYEIEVRAATAAVARSEAALAVAEARRQRAADELARAEGLRGSAAFSTARVEDLGHALAEAVSAVAEADASLASASADLAGAEDMLGRAVIRAPFRGVVTERMAQPGQYIAIGQAAARIVSLDELEVEIDAPVDRLRALAPGTAVTVRIDGAEAPGVVRAVVPRESVSTRTRPVRVAVALDGVDTMVLAPGASATVMAPTSAPRTALVAPKDALVQGRGGWMVFVAVDGQAQPRSVTLGAATGEHIEILSGVAPGDLVVVRGNENLRPGQPVAPTVSGEAGSGGPG